MSEYVLRVQYTLSATVTARDYDAAAEKLDQFLQAVHVTYEVDKKHPRWLDAAAIEIEVEESDCEEL